MSKTKVLIVTQEMNPYTAASEISEIARRLPQHVQEQGMEIRILMPKFGNINERRHRLHEVVRLSGMNIIVDDDDFPLIIKVASVQGARMQVYFLDNEDFFKRKATFEDGDGNAFKDNPDRMIFFCKGVVETVKKFGWAPDIVHCHGWMTSLLPLYLKTAYKSEPLFQDSKVITSVYHNPTKNVFSDNFITKASINDLEAEDLASFKTEAGISLINGAATFSDALIEGSDGSEYEIIDAAKAAGKPVLDYQSPESYLSAYVNFYKSLLEQEETVS
ncbi:MAG: glycogen/starch synthase [Bacteroidota bacterium]